VASLNAAPGGLLAISPESELQVCRALLRAMTGWIARWAKRPVQPVLEAKTIAGGLAKALGARAGGERLIDETLVLCADHELNASSFAARVAASAGAGLLPSVLAALATFTGPKHGGESARVEAFMDEVTRPERAKEVIADRARRGELLPGFGHPLYPGGDPRATALLRSSSRLGSQSAALKRVLAVAAAADRLEMARPNIDFALVAVSAALGLPRRVPSILFCIGRTAGWAAHIQEQRAQGFLLRPRARYVGAPRAS
jgi:citrate synthase